MTTPATPAPSSRLPSGKGEQAAGSSLADTVAGVALRAAEAPKEDPGKKWEEMGAELFATLEAKDSAKFGKLFSRQVKLAVKEALRGNK